MNYHFMVDDKFFNNLIDEIEHLSEGLGNEYYVLKHKVNAIHVSHAKANWIGETEKLISILQTVTVNDRIFIHWYDLQIGKIILTIDKAIPVYVSLMGGDFYGDPIFYHKKWLFDKLTLQRYDLINGYAGTNSTNPLTVIQYYRRLWLKARQSKKEYALKRETIQRINYILLPGKMDGEVALVKKIYKLNELRHLSFSFDQNLDLAKGLPFLKKNIDTCTIQIGNSATYENNHIDLLPLINKFSLNDMKMVLPFSYGDRDYAEFVKKEYYRIFKDKVVYIENFMARSSYVEMLQQVDVCIMYHNRSQALGNCVALLAMGKKVYLKQNNPLWTLFQKAGVLIFDVASISNISFQEFIEPLTAAQASINLENLSIEFSKKTRLADLTKIIYQKMNN